MKTRSPRDVRRVWAWWGACALSWTAAAAATHLFASWLFGRLWVYTIGLVLVVWPAALTVTVVAVVVTVRRLFGLGGAAAGPRPPRWWVACALSWGAVAACNVFGSWLVTRLSGYGFGVMVAAWLAAMTFTVVAVVVTVRRQCGPGGPADPRPPRWWVACALSWGAVAAMHLFWPWLSTWMLLLASGPLAAAWLVALTTSVVAVNMTVRSRGGRVGLATGLIVVAAGATICLVDWRSVFAVGWFVAHRSDFVAVERLARSGELGEPERWMSDGSDLPPRYRGLSVNGKMATATIGKPGGAPVLLLPAHIDIGHTAPYGFVHLTGPAENDGLDGLGQRLRPRIELGDGWWWADYARP